MSWDLVVPVAQAVAAGGTLIAAIGAVGALIYFSRQARTMHATLEATTQQAADDRRRYEADRRRERRRRHEAIRPTITTKSSAGRASTGVTVSFEGNPARDIECFVSWGSTAPEVQDRRPTFQVPFVAAGGSLYFEVASPEAHTGDVGKIAVHYLDLLGSRVMWVQPVEVDIHPMSPYLPAQLVTDLNANGWSSTSDDLDDASFEE